jgi:hypothetical protein
MVHNYLTDNGTFYDAAATALLAATVYRASTLMDEHEFVPFAERTRMTLFTPNGGVGADGNGYVRHLSLPFCRSNSTTTSYSTEFSDYEFFTDDGWLRPVSNPTSKADVLANGESPEAQAFVLMMHAAWRDWRDEGEIGMASGAAAGLTGWAIGGSVAGAIVALLVMGV